MSGAPRRPHVLGSSDTPSPGLMSLFVCVARFRGTIDDCELVEGLVLTQKVASSGVTRLEKAKIGLIQFCLSPPKTDVSVLTHGG